MRKKTLILQPSSIDVLKCSTYSFLYYCIYCMNYSTFSVYTLTCFICVSRCIIKVQAFSFHFGHSGSQTNAEGVKGIEIKKKKLLIVDNFNDKVGSSSSQTRLNLS